MKCKLVQQKVGSNLFGFIFEGLLCGYHIDNVCQLLNLYLGGERDLDSGGQK